MCMCVFEKLLSAENFGIQYSERKEISGGYFVAKNIEFPWDPSDNALMEIILNKLILFRVPSSYFMFLVFFLLPSTYVVCSTIMISIFTE